MEIQFLRCVRRIWSKMASPVPQKIIFGIKIMKIRIPEQCTTYSVQNGIPHASKRGCGTHFVVRDSPRRAPPARLASLAASAGRWAWAAGGTRWRPMLAAISSCSSWQWVRADVEREEAGQTTPSPHSYHRSWVIWYSKSMLAVLIMNSGLGILFYGNSRHSEF